MPGDTDEVGHILVVDDDAMVRQTITNYLEQQNVPAASVSSVSGVGAKKPLPIDRRLFHVAPWTSIEARGLTNVPN